MSVRCAGCMKLFDEQLNICPHCGYAVGSENEISDQIRPGTVLQERYFIGKVLGNGGFGITYIAWDNTLQQKAAIKEYFPRDLSARSSDGMNVSAFSGEKEQNFYIGLKKFIEEARMLARFSDSNGIVNVRDYFEENNTAYIVMEYVEGTTLSELLNRKGKLTDVQTLALVTPIMKALNEIHKDGIIHRDISPDNIMVNSKQIKLLDFGAARIASGGSSNLPMVLKHGYAPEEQYRTKGVQGPWTDIYSLCATMYRCITGIIPDESFERIMNDTLQSPSQLGISINPVIEKIIMKGLSVKSEDRYQSINEIFLDLRGIKNGGSAESTLKPYSTPEISIQQDSDRKSDDGIYDELPQGSAADPVLEEDPESAEEPDDFLNFKDILLNKKNIAIIVLILFTIILSFVLVTRNKNKLNDIISVIQTTTTTATTKETTAETEEYFELETETQTEATSETTSETSSETTTSTTESTTEASTSTSTSKTTANKPKTSATSKTTGKSTTKATKKTEKSTTAKTTEPTTEKPTEKTSADSPAEQDEPVEDEEK